jgi:kynurenine 3-monooxygenase
MQTETSQQITLLGAGLVGSLLGIFLSKRGYDVTIFERRPDMRKGKAGAGRSINLALSERGWRGLEKAGIADAVKEIAIPMYGRVMHDTQGKLTYQPYGKAGQAIYSVSRGGLNMLLMDLAEKQGVKIHFESRCQEVDLNTNTIYLENNDKSFTELKSTAIIGTDGAFSALRSAFQKSDRFDYQQFYIAHGYKELTIPPTASGDFAMPEVNALHIWPRGHFMMIALPNPDKTFTCTLFFPFEGEPSFSSLQSDQDILAFFNQYFPDASGLMPDLLNQYKQNPTSSLVTVKCYPWAKGDALLMGDAAHAIVPFYGQGMNCGFEDCREFDELLDTGLPLKEVFKVFQKQRKPNADAVAELALRNFIEMRDLVADQRFLLRKKIEAKMNELYGEEWIPLYTMVTFRDDIPYATALEKGQQHDKLFDRFMDDLGSLEEVSEQKVDAMARLIMAEVKAQLA